MDAAFIPPPTKPRKPGLPSTRLEIPARANPYSSGPSSSSGDDAESSASTSRSSTSQHVRTGSGSGSQPQKPKLSLFGNTRSSQLASSASGSSNSSRDDVTVAPGFENMSLEDKTMTPGLIQAFQRPSAALAKQKPKLALGSMARMPSSHTHFGSSSPGAGAASTSENMSRSTSFEGALISETSHVNVGGDDYALSAQTLQDLGRLGEGASGEVRKVLHKPSGIIMAKKVILDSLFVSRANSQAKICLSQTIPASPNEDVQKQILRELAFNRECRADFITRYYGAFLEDVST
jgi:mitogen-activated protein kinase kinase